MNTEIKRMLLMSKFIPPWYLVGNIPIVNCAAAYQPKGASNYAASKINLVTPGINNAIDGTAFPDWSAITGWQFARLSNEYLTTGIVPDGNYTVIIRFDNQSGNTNCIFGAQLDDSNSFHLWTAYYEQSFWRNGGQYVGAIISSGVVCMAGHNVYIDGVFINTIGTGAQTFDVLSIGRMYTGADDQGFFFNGNIQAVGIYNITLTALQVGALTTAMAAL